MTTRFPNGDNDADGSWFLEAVGAVEPAPSGADALADLTRENELVTVGDPAEAEQPVSEKNPSSTDSPLSPADSANGAPAIADDARASAHTKMIRTTQTTLSSFDGNPGTANATYAPVGSLPALPIAIPPPTAPPPLPKTVSPTAPPSPVPPIPAATAVEEATPDALSRPLRTGRSFRWPVISILVALIAAVGVAALWLPRATDAKAVAVRQSYYDATSAVRNHLPASQGALDAVTSVQSSSDELSGAVPTIATLDSLAMELQRVAAEPLPSVLPLVPKGTIDALAPLQVQSALLGSEGKDLATRLGNSYIYRVTVPTMLTAGNLPSSATTETVNTISVTLAASLAADAQVIAQLPDDPGFTDVRILATETQARYSEWQTEYLAALSGEDTAGATDLLAELDQMRFDLAEENARALGAMRVELDSWIVSYAAELEAHMSKLTRG